MLQGTAIWAELMWMMVSQRYSIDAAYIDALRGQPESEHRRRSPQQSTRHEAQSRPSWDRWDAPGTRYRAPWPYRQVLSSQRARRQVAEHQGNMLSNTHRVRERRDGEDVITHRSSPWRTAVQDSDRRPCRRRSWAWPSSSQGGHHRKTSRTHSAQHLLR